MRAEGDKVLIRVLSPDDLEAFWALRLQGLQECPVAFGGSYDEEKELPLEEVARHFGHEGIRLFGAFTGDGQLVGIAVLDRAPPQYKRVQHKAEIWGMYVAPRFRGQGIGRALLEAALSHARGLAGLRRINISVMTSNQVAKSLYESCGFERYGVEPEVVRIDGDYYDAAHMTLCLEQEA